MSSTQPQIAIRKSQTHRATLLWNIGRTLFRILTSRYCDLKVYHSHHIPSSGGVLLVCNHQSYLDPILLGVQITRPMSYLARHTLFRNPIFSWLIRNVNAFPVRRGEGDVGAVKEALRRLEDGHMLAMFPEGTRTTSGEMKSLEPGIALVIRRARDLTVIPAVINGSFRAWPKGKKLPQSHPIRLMYGPPLDFAGLRPAQIVSKLEETLRQMLTDLRSGNIARYK